MRPIRIFERLHGEVVGTLRVFFTAALTIAFAVSAGADIARVEVEPYGFDPLSVSVFPGDSVRWVNMDSEAHRPTGVDLSWQTGKIEPGDSLLAVFDSLGFFPYTCALAPLLVGEVIVETATTTPDVPGRVPTTFDLDANYPNPFNPGTSIPFRIKGDQSRHVVLGVYNVLGQEILRLVDSRLGPGEHESYWDGTDERGLPVPSGVYFSRMQVGNEVFAQRMVLTR
jgi:plastocyanin